MTPEECEQIHSLCKAIQTENHPEVFNKLVRDLNDLLESRERRIHAVWKKDAFVPKPPIKSV
jgi:hypothetical protein